VTTAWRTSTTGCPTGRQQPRTHRAPDRDETAASSPIRPPAADFRSAYRPGRSSSVIVTARTPYPGPRPGASSPLGRRSTRTEVLRQLRPRPRHDDSRGPRRSPGVARGRPAPGTRRRRLRLVTRRGRGSSRGYPGFAPTSHHPGRSPSWPWFLRPGARVPYVASRVCGHTGLSSVGLLADAWARSDRRSGVAAWLPRTSVNSPTQLRGHGFRSSIRRLGVAVRAPPSLTAEAPAAFVIVTVPRWRQGRGGDRVWARRAGLVGLCLASRAPRNMVEPSTIRSDIGTAPAADSHTRPRHARS
jgi:hypothetical protein